MSWSKYESAAEKGPWPIFWKVFGLIIGIGLVVGVAGYILGWFGEAAQVAKEEFGPRAALAKYEWFIDQTKFIEKADKDIQLFENRLADVEKQYATYGKDIAKWPPHIQIQYNNELKQAREDLLSVISNRNNLVKDYNAQSSKFNWTPFQTRPDKPPEIYMEYRSQ